MQLHHHHVAERRHEESGVNHGETIQIGWPGEPLGDCKDLDLENKRVVVFGLAKTGLAVCRFLRERGAEVTATDALNKRELGSYAADAAALGIALELGGHRAETLIHADLVVLSPGVPERIPPLEAARTAGVPIVGEIELAFRFIEEPIAAITGTNGKTTTTSLIGEMLRASGREVFVGGNIGAPLIDYVRKGEAADVLVAEISSFQLDTIQFFRPHVAALLNITEDHLDRYDDFNAYVQSKGRIFQNQLGTDVAILNRRDPAVNRLESMITSRKMFFNMDSQAMETEPHGPRGAQIQGDVLMCRFPDMAPVSLDLSRMTLLGKHNRENVAAAALTALAAGGSETGLQRAIDAFQGLPHRLQYVGRVNQVAYYNDSKATNVDAVKRSLESFEQPVILIMGGRDKGGGYAVLEPLVKDRVKGLVIFGEARDKIRAALGRLAPSKEGRSLEEAVHLAHEQAATGDIVLLSPGCSSFDLFSDYADRGKAFVAAVQNLKEC